METKVPILLYHSVSDEVSHDYMPWAISPVRFAEHMAYLATQRYTPLTVGQFVELKLNRAPLPSKPVVLSFDDGLVDFYTYAYPILQQYGFPATMYVVANYVGKTSMWLMPEGEDMRQMMNWSQLKELQAGGIEIGAHTLSHVQLDTQSHPRARQEILDSKAMLEHNMGQSISTFAYPHGYHSQAVRRFVVEAGYTSACAVKHAMSSTNDDTFALARIIIYRETTVPELAQLLAGEGLRVAPRGEQLKTKVWRIVRRFREYTSANSFLSPRSLFEGFRHSEN